MLSSHSTQERVCCHPRAYLKVHSGAAERQKDARQALPAAELQDSRSLQQRPALDAAWGVRRTLNVELLAKEVCQINRTLPELESACIGFMQSGRACSHVGSY